MKKSIELKRMLASGAVLGALSLSVMAPVVNAAVYEGETPTTIGFTEGELPPVDPEEPGIVIPPEGGTGSFALQAVPSGWEFGSTALSPQDSTHTAKSKSNGMVRVADLRGKYEGWKLQARLQPLTTVEEETETGGESRVSNELTGTTVALPATLREYDIVKEELVELNPENTQNPTLTENITINSKNSIITSAAAGTGLGVWQTTFGAPQITIIGGQAQAGNSYEGSIIWTLEDTP